MASHTRWAVPLGDILALLLFAYLGQRSHQSFDANFLSGLLLTAAPFILAWVAVAVVLQSWQRQPSLVAMLGALWLPWLVAAPLGVLLRALIQQRTDIPLVFVLTTLVFGGGVLTVWRLVAWGFGLQRRPATPANGHTA